MSYEHLGYRPIPDLFALPVTDKQKTSQIVFSHIGTFPLEWDEAKLPEHFTWTKGMEGAEWQKVRQLMGALWEAYFGSEEKKITGLLSHLSEEAKEVAMDTLELGMAVSLYGHQLQKRGTGDLYWTHPAEVALYEAGSFHWSVTEAVEALCHDLHEDTQKMFKNQKTKEIIGMYPFVVTNKFLSHAFGRPIGQTTEALTEVRKTHKTAGGEVVTKDKVATQFKFATRSLRQPKIGIHKVGGDRLHNMRTISGKPLIDQVDIATDTFEMHRQFARILGLHKEARELEERCFRIIDQHMYADNLVVAVDGFLAEKQRLFAQLNLIKNAQSHAARALTLLPYGFVDFRLTFPTNYAYMQKLTKRQIDTQAFFLEATLVLTDQEPIDETLVSVTQHGFLFRAAQAVSALGFSKAFASPPEQTIGIGSIIRAADANVTYDGLVKLVFHQDGVRVPLVIRIVPKSRDDFEQTSLAYLNAVSLLPGDEHKGISLKEWQVRAQQKQAILLAEFEGMIRKGMSKQAILREYIATLSDSIEVTAVVQTEEKKQEKHRTPIPTAATLMDYLLLKHADNWWTYATIKLNGQTYPLHEVISRVLEPGDEIEMEKSDAQAMLTIEFLDALTLPSAEIRRQVQDRLEFSLHQAESDGTLQSALLKRGMQKIKDRVPTVELFGIHMAQEVFPKKYPQVADVCVAIGLGTLHGKEFEVIVQTLTNYAKEKLIQVEVAVAAGNRPGIVASIASLLNKRKIPFQYFEAKKPVGEGQIRFVVSRDQLPGTTIEPVLTLLKKHHFRVVRVEDGLEGW